MKMKAEGYVHDTRLVLQNIEEEKELAICSHCEKLAIAYGLLCLPTGTTIRVYIRTFGCVLIAILLPSLFLR